MKPKVVADASSFMCLEREPELFCFYHELFEAVLIPGAVAEELVEKDEITIIQYFSKYHLHRLVRVVSPIDLVDFVRKRIPPLGRGESEVISLAIREQLWAVIEDKRARNFANRNQVEAANMAFFAVDGYHNGNLTRNRAIEMVLAMHRLKMFGDVFLAEFMKRL